MTAPPKPPPPGTSSTGRCTICGARFESASDGIGVTDQGFVLTDHRRTGRKLSDHATQEHPQDTP